MAWLLVRLKLRSLANVLRSSTRARVAFLVSTTLAVMVAALTFSGLAVLRGQTGAVDLSTVVFTVFAFGWLSLPLMAFSLDATLDPATLALFPLRPGRLAVGLLAASVAGPWPLANLAGLAGVTIGLASGGLGWPAAESAVALLAVALELLFCVTLARFVTTSLARVLRSRRGKDVAAFLALPLIALYEVVGQVVPKLTAEGKLTSASFAGADRWLRWLPPGLAAHAVADAADGRPGLALARLASLALITVALGWLWVRSLGRALVSVDTSTQSQAVRGTGLPFTRYGLGGTVAARYWLYQRRDPVAVMYWGIIAVIMVAASVSTVLTPAYQGAVLGSGAMGGAFISVLHANSIGLSGPGFGVEAMALTSPRAMRAYLIGRDSALVLVAVPLFAAISFGLAVMAGHPATGFLGVAVDLAGIGAGLALGNVFAVVLAYPVERRLSSPVPNASEGFTGNALAATFGSLIGVAVAASPVVAAAVLTRHVAPVVRMPLLVGLAAAYGIGLAWAGVRIAAGAALPRLPELCQIAARSKL